MGIFFTSSHFVSQFPPTRFPLITAIRMCHFLPVHQLGMAFLAWSKVKIQYSLKFARQKLTKHFSSYAMLTINKTQSWNIRKGSILLFTKKGQFIIIKNNRCITLTAIAAKVCYDPLQTRIQHEVKVKKKKISERLSKKSIHSILYPEYRSNYQRSTSKNSRGNSIVLRFLKGSWFYTLWECGENITCRWPP